MRESPVKSALLQILGDVKGPLEARIWRPTHGPVGRLPDFLGIGVPKAGTTWLYENLRSHPNTYLPPKKELHYFDLNFHRPVSWYESWFHPSDGALSVGEITPSYSVLPKRRIAAVARLIPAAKLIVLLRNPVERAWSHAMMKVVKRSQLPFDQINTQEIWSNLTGQPSLVRGDYPTILERWLRHFDIEQLFVGLYEDLALEPRVLLSSVIQFLGLPAIADWSSVPHNSYFLKGPGISIPPEYEEALYQLYAPIIERMIGEYGERFSRWRRN